MNKRILYSGLSILTSAALMTAGTFAYFSDTGSSTGNTFSTGTLDLKLTDADETAVDSVAASFGGTLAPGACTGVQTLSLKNTGTSTGDHAEIGIANVVTDVVPNATPDMHSYLKINTLTYDGIDVSTQVTDLNGNTWLDLADWEAGAGLDNLALTNLNTDHALAMDVCLDASAPNEVQGDSVASTLTVTLNQHLSQ